MRIVCWIFLVINLVGMSLNWYFASKQNDIGNVAGLIMNATGLLFLWDALLADRLRREIALSHTHTYVRTLTND